MYGTPINMPICLNIATHRVRPGPYWHSAYTYTDNTITPSLTLPRSLHQGTKQSEKNELELGWQSPPRVAFNSFNHLEVGRAPHGLPLFLRSQTFEQTLGLYARTLSLTQQLLAEPPTGCLHEIRPRPEQDIVCAKAWRGIG